MSRGGRASRTGERRYAQVAVPVPRYTPFTYLIPESLEEEVAPGSLVCVPFRNSFAAGLVLEAAQGPPPDFSGEVKELAAPLLEGAAVPSEIMELIRWLGSYYLYPPGLVAKTALPEGLMGRPRPVFRATKKGRSALKKGSSDKEASSLIREAREKDGVSPGAAAHKKMCQRLCREGLMEMKWELPALMRGPRRLKYVSAVKDENRAVQELTVREESILEHLQGGGLFLKELKEKAPNTRRWLRSLEDKGLVELTLREAPPSAEAPFEAREEGPITLNPEQEVALKRVTSALGGFGVFLLFGVTGSGKTEVYLRAITEALNRGGGCLVMVPEIGLTPQMEARFRARLGEELAVLHSGLSARVRLAEWLRVRRGEARVVLGTRSAVFAPVKDLSLIVVDEEHDPSYKQDEGLTYHGRDVAVMRGKFIGAPVVLGSATPSVESFHHAAAGRYERLDLPGRIDGRAMPEVEVIDMRGSREPVSPRLRELFRENLEAGGQAVFFLNRRGHASFVLCRECGFVARCTRCEVSLTLHKGPERLLCHYCGLTLPPEPRCPRCSCALKPYGVGTQMVAEELKRLFPGCRVARMDSETTSKKDSHRRLIESMDRREVDVLVGTQMVSKGHHLPGVALVGVINADTGLNLPDFRASERTFQLLTQVAGRAGRGERPGRVVVQTFNPEHPSIEAARTQDYLAFFEEEIESRRELGLPPFSRVVRLVVSAGSRGLARSAAKRLGERAKRLAAETGAQVLGPAPAPLSRLRGRFRMHLIVKGEGTLGINRLAARLVTFLRKERGVRVGLDVDPLQML